MQTHQSTDGQNYRAKARETEALARGARSVAEREAYESLSRSWVRMADEAESGGADLGRWKSRY